MIIVFAYAVLALDFLVLAILLYVMILEVSDIRRRR